MNSRHASLDARAILGAIVDWLETHGLTLALGATLMFHWVRVEIKLALVVRDLEWVRAALAANGFAGPIGKGG